MSFPMPRSIERMGNACVSKLFFTKIPLGFVRVQLLWLFFGSSCFVFANAIYVVIHKQQQEIAAVGDNLWYRKAQKFRAERNFWLSLFNAFLWLIVFEIHCLKRLKIKLKGEVSELKTKITEYENQITELLKSEGTKKND